jgi:hypothetical protein
MKTTNSTNEKNANYEVNGHDFGLIAGSHLSSELPAAASKALQYGHTLTKRGFPDLKSNMQRG